MFHTVSQRTEITVKIIVSTDGTPVWVTQWFGKIRSYGLVIYKVGLNFPGVNIRQWSLKRKEPFKQETITE